MKQKRESKKRFWHFFLFTIILIGATLIGLVFRMIGFPETNIVLLYILGVLIISRFTGGYAFGLTGSVFATGAFNYFFTEPYYSLSVYDSSYLITFSIMMATAFITSTLTSKIKMNAELAQKRESDANALYRLTSRLTDATEISDIAFIIVETVSELFKCRAACLVYTDQQEPEKTFVQQQRKGKQIRREVQDTLALKHQMDGLRTACNVGEEFHDWPLYGRGIILGLLRIPNQEASLLDDSQVRLLHSMIESTSLAMDRVRSVIERLKLKEEATQERYRGNLLRAISHDIRTPLSSIMGTSEMIMGVTDPETDVYAMANNTYSDAKRLHSLVENILALTRLHEGKLLPEKQLEAVEEVLGSAVKAMANRLADYSVRVVIPDEVLMVPMDVKLIEQVLINLLDNAAKHTPPQEEICISVVENKTDKQAEFHIADRGEGIPSADLPYIFQMFFTSHSDKKEKRRGIGLGLSICESIVIAHGGTIKASNRTDGPGAEFVFTIPLQSGSLVDETRNL